MAWEMPTPHAAGANEKKDTSVGFSFFQRELHWLVPKLPRQNARAAGE